MNILAFDIPTLHPFWFQLNWCILSHVSKMIQDVLCQELQDASQNLVHDFVKSPVGSKKGTTLMMTLSYCLLLAHWLTSMPQPEVDHKHHWLSNCDNSLIALLDLLPHAAFIFMMTLTRKHLQVMMKMLNHPEKVQRLRHEAKEKASSNMMTQRPILSEKVIHHSMIPVLPVSRVRKLHSSLMTQQIKPR